MLIETTNSKEEEEEEEEKFVLFSLLFTYRS